jgi:tetratricopeptide (TPR) repeat protein
MFKNLLFHLLYRLNSVSARTRGALEDLWSLSLGSFRLLLSNTKKFAALLTLIVAVTCIPAWYFWFGTDAQAARLESVAASHFQEGDYASAASAFQRITQLDANCNERVYLAWLNSVRRLGDEARLNDLLQELAPESEAGLAAAHRIIAVELSNGLRRGKANNLERLRWHLNNSGDDKSVDINLAWARYFVAVGDGQSAVDRFRVAAEFDPCYWLNVLTIRATLDDRRRLERELLEAEKALKKLLAATPTNDRLRLALAEFYFKTKRYADCEAVLRAETDLPTDQLEQMRARVLVARYVDSESSNTPAESLQLVGEAFRLDPSSEKVLQLFEHLYLNAETNDHKQAVVDILLAFLGQNPPASQAGQVQFLLGKLYVIEGDLEKAQQFAETALRKDDEPRRSHLVAWLLLKSPQKSGQQGLLRARELAQHAVSMEPVNFTFQYTLARTQAATQQFRSAITTLETALIGSKVKSSRRKDVHQLLSVCYRELQMHELADAHARNYAASNLTSGAE